MIGQSSWSTRPAVQWNKICQSVKVEQIILIWIVCDLQLKYNWYILYIYWYKHKNKFFLGEPCSITNIRKFAYFSNDTGVNSIWIMASISCSIQSLNNMPFFVCSLYVWTLKNQCTGTANHLSYNVLLLAYNCTNLNMRWWWALIEWVNQMPITHGIHCTAWQIYGMKSKEYVWWTLWLRILHQIWVGLMWQQLDI